MLRKDNDDKRYQSYITDTDTIWALLLNRQRPIVGAELIELNRLYRERVQQYAAGN